ncbi:AP-1-like transcription factor napA [Golovinomyces cichoracearum]|uniref:AP-1-like transcription factor napA n=1 Tax=Golovinomyces cichoracearum TaxID=62708 RepID=A0A420HMT2_9PEZI|nr:AP-1-like transcription factor napA [Golovinomyces cichoracearum]
MELQIQASQFLNFDGKVKSEPVAEHDSETRGTKSAHENINSKAKFDSSGSSNDGNDAHDKRSLPNDEDLDGEEGVRKRQENHRRIPRKHGRKPVTSEPTTKRKAQNRAAQRAFRERKEKYLKDLEMKVEDLHTASESASQENRILHEQIEKMSAELQEYRKIFSIIENANRISPVNGQKNLKHPNPDEFNFNVDFTKLSGLYGHPLAMNHPRDSPVTSQMSHVCYNQTGSQNQSSQYPALRILPEALPQTPKLACETELSCISNVFNANLTQSDLNDAHFDHFSVQGHNSKVYVKNLTKPSSRINLPNKNIITENKILFSPPSTFLNDQNAVLSSFKFITHPRTYSEASDLSSTTIDQEDSCMSKEKEFTYQEELNISRDDKNYSAMDLRRDLESDINFQNLETSHYHANGISWLAEQNEYQFNPSLTREYRELQENFPSEEKFGECLHDDSFLTPVLENSRDLSENHAVSANNLVTSSDDKRVERKIIKPEDYIASWDHIPSSLDSNRGDLDLDLDLDALCSELQKKAKCTDSCQVYEDLSQLRDYKMRLQRNAKKKIEP